MFRTDDASMLFAIGSKLKSVSVRSRFWMMHFWTSMWQMEYLMEFTVLSKMDDVARKMAMFEKSIVIVDVRSKVGCELNDIFVDR